MGVSQSTTEREWVTSLERRLYHGMLVTRLFEDALLRWEQEGKISAQTFPSKGQEAIAIGCCLALEKGDTVIPSFRTRGAMIGMGVSIVEQLREFVHSPLAAGDSRDAPHHSSWPDRGVMPGSTMIGGHLAMAAGLALAMQNEKQGAVSVAFFGDGTLGSGDLHETMHIAGMWGLPLVLVCENNGWEMSTLWAKVRRTRSLIPMPSRSALRRATSTETMPWMFIRRRAGRARRQREASRFFSIASRFDSDFTVPTSAKCGQELKTSWQSGPSAIR
jgi:TPP-dependent pyruvate/acetoin dehydrogenase alpha subunit